jgi:hypothetical protein
MRVARKVAGAADAARGARLLALALLALAGSACVVELPPDLVSDDAGPPDARPDAGEPARCLFDQDRPEGTGCPSGQVCNLKTGRCGPGFTCASDDDCLVCTSATRPPDDELGDVCGHGFAVTSWCDLEHHPDEGVGVCTRTRSPCERCLDDADCGRLNDGLALPPGFLEGPLQVRCVDYAEELGLEPSPETRFCSRPCDPFDSDVLGCPNNFFCVGEVRPGFAPDDPGREGRCLQARNQCARNPLFCPAPADEPDSVRQITPPAQCPEGGICETNDRPGATGLCLGECRNDIDCVDPARPICNRGNGLCIPGCAANAGCADLLEQPQVCHPLVGDCDLVCYEEGNDAKDTFVDADTFCEQKYGAQHGDVYCNVQGRDGRDGHYFKPYHDEFACVRRGCELSASGKTQADCGGPNRFCNLDAPGYPQCQLGCRDQSDCAFGWSCRVGDDHVEYSPEECAELEIFDAPAHDLGAHGVCCQEPL